MNGRVLAGLAVIFLTVVHPLAGLGGAIVLGIVLIAKEK